jgi:hypothetical protein
MCGWLPFRKRMMEEIGVTEEVKGKEGDYGILRGMMAMLVCKEVRFSAKTMRRDPQLGRWRWLVLGCERSWVCELCIPH